jgi:aminoglycoside phosphotransferase family enzyme
MVESLRDCLDWSQDEHPIEIIRTHISVVLLGKHRVLKLKSPSISGFWITRRSRRAATLAGLKSNLIADSERGTMRAFSR